MLGTVAIPILNVSTIPCLGHSNAAVRTFGFVTGIIVGLLLVMLVWSWLAVLVMNPGRLDVELKKWGESQFVERTPCPKCGLPKPIRCHHCSKCGCCIMFMDHHCKVIGQCLGFRNYKAFILVLYYAAATCSFHSLAMLIEIFFDLKQSRIGQIGLIFFLLIVTGGSIGFAQIYMDLKARNLTTIETKFAMIDNVEHPNIPIFEPGLRKLFPVPLDVNPFLYC
jgi:palmitoyltransferase